MRFNPSALSNPAIKLAGAPFSDAAGNKYARLPNGDYAVLTEVTVKGAIPLEVEGFGQIKAVRASSTEGKAAAAAESAGGGIMDSLYFYPAVGIGAVGLLVGLYLKFGRS